MVEQIEIGRIANYGDVVEITNYSPMPGHSEIPFFVARIIPEMDTRKAYARMHRSVWEVKDTYSKEFDLSKLNFEKLIPGTFQLKIYDMGGLSNGRFVVHFHYFPGQYYRATISVDLKQREERFHKTREEVIKVYTPYFGEQVSKLHFVFQ